MLRKTNFQTYANIAFNERGFVKKKKRKNCPINRLIEGDYQAERSANFLIDTERLSWPEPFESTRVHGDEIYRVLISERLPLTFYHLVHLLSFHRCFSLVPSRCIPPCNVILCYAHQVCCQNATLLISPKWLLDRSKNRKMPINVYASINSPLRHLYSRTCFSRINFVSLFASFMSVWYWSLSLSLTG